MPSLVRAVATQLDGTIEKSEWYLEGSTEAEEAMRALIHKQVKEGFSVSWERQEAADAGALPS